MKNANEPISPVLTQSASLQNETSLGLTKREYFAGLAMQGLIAGRWACPDNVPNDVETITREALLHADELLKQLENKK
ncbi:hypothetical protein CMU55_19260 [Elizabethkingia anophelis]|nr:hypothetical protein [Elizabethkingia anophelis]